MKTKLVILATKWKAISQCRGENIYNENHRNKRYGGAAWNSKMSIQKELPKKEAGEEKTVKTNRRKMTPGPSIPFILLITSPLGEAERERHQKRLLRVSQKHPLHLSDPLLDPLRPSNCFYSHFYEPEMKYGMSNFKTENNDANRYEKHLKSSAFSKQLHSLRINKLYLSTRPQ